MRLLCSLLLVGATVPVVRGQQPPVRRLRQPELRFTGPFSSVAGIAELPDGRLLVSDRVEATVSVIGEGTRALVGRQGQGPREYGRPFTIVRLSPDTFAVHDAPNRRLFLVDARGRVLGTIPLDETLWHDGSVSSSRGADRNGRLYFEQSLRATGPEPVTVTGRVIRWSPGHEVEPVVDLQVRDRQNRRILRPFITRDEWDVAPDGTVFVLRGEDYHPEWVLPSGNRRVGPRVRLEAIALDDAEIDAYTRNAAVQGSASMSPRSGVQPADEGQRRELRRNWVFPTHLPPTVREGAMISPTGEAWVVRAKAWDAPSFLIDVFAPDGTRRSTVELPPGRRLLGFGDRGLYLARIDPDGLEWIERYALPF